MAKLTDTQLVILSAAAQRDDLAVTAIDKRAATKEAITALLKAKHLRTAPRTGDMALWEKTSEGEQLGLVATPKALKPLGVEEGPVDGVTTTVDITEPPRTTKRASRAAKAEMGKPAGKSKASPPARKAESKLDRIVALMRRAKGATLADMMAATDWQAHSIRGAISGAIKKKLGLAVLSEKTGETRFYRITA